jgi:hypothetical protein
MKECLERRIDVGWELVWVYNSGELETEQSIWNWFSKNKLPVEGQTMPRITFGGSIIATSIIYRIIVSSTHIASDSL